MPSISNTAEGLTEATTPTTGNTGGASGTACSNVTIAGASSITALAAAAIYGVRGYRMAQSAGGDTTRLIWSLSESGRFVMSAYVRIDATPAQVEDILGIRHGSGNMGVVSIAGDGKLIVQNAAGTGITASKSPNPISPGVYLVQMSASKGTTTSDGTLGVHLSQDGATIHTWESAAQNSGTNDVSAVWIGRSTTRSESHTLDYDQIRGESLTSGWLAHVEARTAEVGDPSGIADAASRTITAARTAADPVGLSDTATAIVIAVRSLADAAALIDLPGEQALAISLPIDDGADIGDAVTQMVTAARTVTDAIGIVDTASAQLLSFTETSIADQEGLTDSSAAAASATRGPDEAAGIADQAAATLAVTRTPTDQLGATDSVTVSITSAGDALVTDTVGAVDQVTVSATSSRTIADAVTLTDGATAILTAGAIPVEMIGLGDAVTAELTTTRDVSEAIGVVDQVAAFLLSRGEAADPAGIGDQVAAEIQRARQADDVTEVSDTLATLAVSVRTLTDTGTLTDVVTAVLAPSVAPLGRTLLVYYERRYRPGWTGTIDHDPQAKLDYTWDWTDWLGGDTIISATVTARVEEGRDSADVVTIDDVWLSSKTITAWILGGVHGTPCAVTCRITTTAGRIDDRTIRLRVRDR